MPKYGVWQTGLMTHERTVEIAGELFLAISCRERFRGFLDAMMELCQKHDLALLHRPMETLVAGASDGIVLGEFLYLAPGRQGYGYAYQGKTLKEATRSISNVRVI